MTLVAACQFEPPVGDPQGEVLVEEDDEPGTITATVDPDRVWISQNHNPVRQRRDRPPRPPFRPETCPDCGGDLEHRSGSVLCVACNWHPRYPAD